MLLFSRPLQLDSTSYCTSACPVFIYTIVFFQRARRCCARTPVGGGARDAPPRRWRAEPILSVAPPSERRAPSPSRGRPRARPPARARVRHAHARRPRAAQLASPGVGARHGELGHDGRRGFVGQTCPTNRRRRRRRRRAATTTSVSSVRRRERHDRSERRRVTQLSYLMNDSCPLRARLATRAASFFADGARNETTPPLEAGRVVGRAQERVTRSSLSSVWRSLRFFCCSKMFFGPPGRGARRGRRRALTRAARRVGGEGRPSAAGDPTGELGRAGVGFRVVTVRAGGATGIDQHQPGALVDAATERVTGSLNRNFTRAIKARLEKKKRKKKSLGRTHK